MTTSETPKDPPPPRPPREPEPVDHLVARAFTLLALLAMACTDRGPAQPEIVFRVSCTDGEREQMRSWVLACIDKANPHSDEEPEDWIESCRETAKPMFCSKVKGLKVLDGEAFGGEPIPCFRAIEPQHMAMCEAGQ